MSALDRWFVWVDRLPTALSLPLYFFSLGVLLPIAVGFLIVGFMVVTAPLIYVGMLWR